MFLSKVHACCWGGGGNGVEYGVTPPSRHWGDRFSVCCSGGLHRRANSFPSCVSGFHQIPTPPQPVCAHLSACQVPWCSCVLSLGQGYDSKLQIFKSSAKLGFTSVLWRRALWHAGHHPVPEKWVLSAWWLDSIVMHNEKLRPGYLPSEDASAPATEWPLSDFWWTLCPWRGRIPSSKGTPGGESLSPSATQGIPSPWCIVRILCSTLSLSP